MFRFPFNSKKQISRSRLHHLNPSASRRISQAQQPVLEDLERRVLLSFTTPLSDPTGTNPAATASADLNGDGRMDLVVANRSANTVSVLLGNGDGTFGPKIDYATGAAPTALAVGDFNGDGKMDVVTSNFAANSVSILLGNGDGTLRPKTDLTLTTTPVSITAVDLNGDGRLDLAVATEDLSNDYVNVLRGNGDGTFQAAISTVTDSAPKGIGLTAEPFSTIGAADFNGDGHPDLVVVNNKDAFVQRSGVIYFGGSVSVMLGNGDGTVKAPLITAVGTSPRNVAVGDFNGDGRADFAVGNYMSGTLSVFMNTGGGSFTLSTLAPDGAPFSLAAADFNGDGRSDLAVGLANIGTGINLNLLFGQAGGTLQSADKYIMPDFISLSAADFNGDGRIDLAGAMQNPDNRLYIFPNSGNGMLQAPFLIANPGVALLSQATADFNGDGIPDLVTESPGQIQLGLGDGFFGDATPIIGGLVAVADVDGNGTPDVLVRNSSFPVGQVALYLNSPGFDNRTGGAVGFTVSAPVQATAGSAFSVTVTAVDALGNAVPGFLGTVDLDSTQAGSTALKLAGQYSFTAADAGRHTFLISNLTQASGYTLSAFAVAMPTVSASVTVVPAALAQFSVAKPASVAAGTPFSFTVTAQDQYGNVENNYSGTIHFSDMSSDTQAVLPADYTFTSADAGTHTFSATLFKTSGSSSPFIGVTDTATNVSTLTPIAVTPLAPNTLTMSSLFGQVAAGTQVGVTVAALDIYGNVATSYSGTVHFSSPDVQAGLPGDYTFTPGQGAHTFLLTFKTAGTQSLTVTDTANPAFTSTQSIALVPGAPAVWAVSGLPASTTAGVAQSFTLTAMDACGNVATNYFGRIHFSSSDPQAALPVDYTFTLADAGSHTFSATLKTAGTQSISFADTLTTTFAGVQNIVVTAAAASSVTLTGFPATTAGVAHTFTVTLKDAFGNLASGYSGTVGFSSSDPLAALPANYTFTSADAGSHTFTAALKKAGTQSITIKDAALAGLTSTESGIAVSPAAVTHFAIVFPATVTQGVGFNITVSAVDDFGNVNAGYRGAVHLSSTDPKAGTQNFTFSNNDNGVHIFSYTFNALGLQTLTIVDTLNSSIVGSAIINVVPK